MTTLEVFFEICKKNCFSWLVFLNFRYYFLNLIFLIYIIYTAGFWTIVNWDSLICLLQKRHVQIAIAVIRILVFLTEHGFYQRFYARTTIFGTSFQTTSTFYYFTKCWDFVTSTVGVLLIICKIWIKFYLFSRYTLQKETLTFWKLYSKQFRL